MDLFLQIALSFPTLVFSVLLAVAVVYWLLAVMGLFNLEVPLMPEGEASEIGGIPALLARLRLDGVPLPLISDGGSSLIAGMAAIGVVLSIERNNHLVLDGGMRRPLRPQR